MSAAAQIDYDALAKEHGGSAAASTIDYDALAREGGGVLAQPGDEKKADDTGIWAGVKRNTIGAIAGLYHAFADPATEQEKTKLLKAVQSEKSWQTAHGYDPNQVDESLATNPSRIALALHRIVDAPAGELAAKGKSEVDIAQDLLGKKETWKGANAYLSGRMDQGLSTIPMVGPWINSVAERAEKGDYSGAATDIAAAVAVSKSGELVKGAAGLVGDTGGVIRSGWRKIGNPFGLASTGEELLTQGISPRTSLTKFGPSLEKAAGDLKAFDAQSPIRNVHDLNDAIPEIKQKIWSEEVEPALQRQATKTVDMQPVAEKVRAQVSDEMRTFDEANAEKLDKLADKLETAKDVKGANSLLKYINGQLESYFQKFPAARRANLMNNPETAGWEAARSELRNQFLDTLESAGETGVRDARLRYGAFDTLQDAVERRVNVADRAKPMSLGRIVGLAGAAPTGGLSLVAGELSNYLNKPDVLIRRGISKLPEPVRATPFAPAAVTNPLAPSGTVSPITRGKLATPAQLFTRPAESSAFSTAANEETLAHIERQLKRVGLSDEERGILERQRDDYKAMGGSR